MSNYSKMEQLIESLYTYEKLTPHGSAMYRELYRSAWLISEILSSVKYNTRYGTSLSESDELEMYRRAFSRLIDVWDNYIDDAMPQYVDNPLYEDTIPAPSSTL